MLCVKGIGKDHAKFSPVGEKSGLHQPSGLSLVRDACTWFPFSLQLQPPTASSLRLRSLDQ